jgi:ssRNA-specific RNase YbeY (16S rRNA maturation enzyme)
LTSNSKTTNKNERFHRPFFRSNPKGQILFLQSTPLGFIAQELQIAASLVALVEDDEGRESDEDSHNGQRWPDVLSLAAGTDVCVGDESLTYQQPHDSMIGDVVFVPDHFTNDRRI